MSEPTPPKRPKPGTRSRVARKDLSHLADLGATTRGHRIFRDLRSFLVPVLVALALQTAAYLTFYTRTVPNWSAALTVVGILSLVPIASALTLGAFRRHEAPIIAATGMVAIFFSFAITYLSALRIPVSFAGFAAAFPLSVLAMAIGNIRFHQRLAARVFHVFGGAEDRTGQLRVRFGRLCDDDDIRPVLCCAKPDCMTDASARAGDE